MLLAHLGDPEAAFNAFLPELRLTSIRYGSLWFPVMSKLRQLPEFKELVQDVGLVEYWQNNGWPTLCRPIDQTDFICD